MINPKWRHRLADWLEDISERVRPKPREMTFPEMIAAQRLVNRHMTQHIEVLKGSARDAAEAQFEAHRIAFESALDDLRNDLKP